MATVSERLAFLITADATSAIKAFEATGKAADKELGKAEQRLDKVGAGMTRFGAGALAAAGVAAAGLYNLAGAAGDLEAAIAANNQVLGEAGEAFQDWADDSVEAVGLSKRATVEAGTAFGGLGEKIGLAGDDLVEFSKANVQLAADMAAFKDVSPEQALQDLQSAFAGSTEVLRKYNIFLDEGSLKAAFFRETGEEVTGTLTAQQRIIATNSEIMEQASTISGQWGRESNSLAAEQAKLSAELENLQAGIGAGVLPVVTSLVGGLNDAAGAFGNLNPEVQAGVGTVAAYGTAALGIVGSLSLAGGQLIKFRDNLTNVGDDGSRSLNKLGRTAQAAGVALAAFAAIEIANTAFDSVTDRAADTEKAINDYVTTVLDVKATNEEVIASIGELADENKGLAQTFKDIADIEFLSGSDQFKVQLGEIKVDADQLRDTLDAVFNDPRADQGRTIEALKELLGTLDEGSIKYDILSEEIDRYEERVKSKTAAEKATADASAEAADEIDEMAGAASGAAVEVKSLEDKFRGLLGLLDEEDALLDVTDQFADLIEKTIEAGDTSEKSAADIAQDQRDVQRAVNDTKREVIDYATSVKGIPAEALTDILALIDQGAYAEALRLLDELTKERSAIVQVQTRIAAAQAAGQAVTPGGVRPTKSDERAYGGPVQAGVGYSINETGATEVFVPHSDGFVYPAAKARDQAPQTVNVSALVDEIKASNDRVVAAVLSAASAKPYAETLTDAQFARRLVYT